jgi:ABC-type multidrug transport system fused ATPase/permease subunit
MQLNFLSGLAAVGLSFLILPVQTQIAKRFAIMRRETASKTDSRVRHMSEIINGITSVKGYGWEQPFSQLILDIRNSELKNVLSAQRLRAINYCLYFCSPHIASFATFMVFFAMGGTLTLSKVFTTLSYLQILRLDIGRFFTRGIETTSEAFTSSHRIESFLDLFKSNDTQENKHVDNANSEINSQENVKNDGLLFEISNSNFSYGSNAPILKNIDIKGNCGELIMVVGPGSYVLLVFLFLFSHII